MRRAVALYITDPYALRDALVAQGLKVPAVQEIIEQLRPRAEECLTGRWIEKVGHGLMREHRVMRVFCAGHEPEWERYVWGDEAHDALALHHREEHVNDAGRSAGFDRVGGYAEHSTWNTEPEGGPIGWTASPPAPVFTRPADTSSEE